VIIGVGLDARLGLPFDQLRVAAREGERFGYESVWTPAGGVPDSFHVCAAWLVDTTMRAGISVVPAARVWSPLSLAMQAATLAQLSSGRFVLGIGTGGAGPAFWESIGLANRPIGFMREYTKAVRALLAGETVTVTAPTGHPAPAALGLPAPIDAPVYLGALGRQMVQLAGEAADGVLLNWASPERIAASRAFVAEGATKAGRDPAEVSVTMYIRVCVDDDVQAARRAYGAQVLGYALAQPGVPLDASYRGMFGQMGYEQELLDLEARRERGASMIELIDAAPDEMFRAVGYYGPAAGAADEYARLSAGLDETIVRIVTARPGLEPVVEAMAALTPAAIRAVAADK
jgi:alkanesulfonate monooxygenase SsuD/methylene tetrahydromethanopterin reductase-like flavin-dependent oxidoreductase (luciferase family)